MITPVVLAFGPVVINLMLKIIDWVHWKDEKKALQAKNQFLVMCKGHIETQQQCLAEGGANGDTKPGNE